MKQGFSPKELKTILFSKRANIYYLEKCRVMQNIMGPLSRPLKKYLSVS